MRVEILHIPDCPNSAEAETRVRAALDESGHSSTEIELHLLSSGDDAAAVAFAGSPTILLDGIDAFGGDGRTADLACRIYRTPTGFAGVPTVEDLIAVIRQRYETGR
jgi:hypothetical protein